MATESTAVARVHDLALGPSPMPYMCAVSVFGRNDQWSSVQSKFIINSTTTKGIWRIKKALKRLRRDNLKFALISPNSDTRYVCECLPSYGNHRFSVRFYVSVLGDSNHCRIMFSIFLASPVVFSVIIYLSAVICCHLMIYLFSVELLRSRDATAERHCDSRTTQVSTNDT